MDKKRQLFVLNILAACVTSSFAATPIDLYNQPITALEPFLAKKGFAPSGFAEVSTNVDFNQTTHVRLQQTYAGFPVWGADVIVHIPKDKNHRLTANQNANLDGLVYQDLQKDLNHVSSFIFSPGKVNEVLDKSIMLYQQKAGSNYTISEKKADLIVYVDQKQIAHWAYVASFLATPHQGMPAKPTVVMNATTLEIYHTWDDIQTIDNIQGGGFGGNQKMGQLTYDGLGNNLSKLSMQRDATTQMCSLQNSDVTVKDFSKNNVVMQFSCQKTDHAHGDIYWGADHDKVNGAYSPGNDALYAGMVIKDMYQKWYNVPVLTQNGEPMMLVMRVHENIENAYWDGSQMTFGDGGSMFYPLVSLGVGAHEVSHGFTQQHSNLFYFGQPGGINEAFSDMAAQAAEFYSNGHNTWQIGSEIMKGNGALRYMDEPTKDCKNKNPGSNCSISHVKDYTFGLDVHYSSGVFNKAFYLIATSPGWDTRKAFDIMVQANSNYWMKLSNFALAACGVIKATQDHKYPVEAVKGAFNQVGIDTSRC